ncbi:MAG: glycosyltransferase [Gammaproteobacteria bacterium]|nr:glycosyltransferase [Gammaproteobacteria bacterium]NIM74837.1 glycosyltransferase [Gammaproteobacteria bacterium]NIN39269.1 glycosyltransferase [Gammaproteobacteria bacterium]NIO26755.1 glycosyltransferase [Gammaproteobacteria bacterium]NIO67311.1 glycosyltransferase [Gammaproteobacteria bacterium]
MAGAIAFLLKGYPRLSETFIANEIRALEKRGLDIRIVSLRRPTDRERHPVHAEIRARVHYLPEYLYRAPFRVFASWRRARRRPGYRDCLRAWWRDVRRDPSPNRVRRFGQALVLAAEIDDDVIHLHAHFLHTPASVARYTSLLLDLPWSCSAHARDIWTTPEWEKREKLASCRWAVTCTAANHRHLAALAPDPARVSLVYHGLDAARFPATVADGSSRDGSDAGDPVRILSVGRAVEKKGYDDLLAALARLPADVHWRFEHVGGGPRLRRLKRLAASLGIAERIRWRGALAGPAVLASYAQADMFVLSSRIARDGDRDGLPNVLMEAQSQGLACVSTRVSAIPELLEDRSNGLLVDAGDVQALADAMLGLIREPAQRHRLGAAGRARVAHEFRFEDGIDRLQARLAGAG